MIGHPPLSADGYIHASAVVVGEAGVLIRGASGSGKSTLTDALMHEAARRGMFARLIGDDRVHVERVHQRLLVRGHPAIRGLIERRGQGIVRLDACDNAVVRLIVDLVTEPSERLPIDKPALISFLDVAIAHLQLWSNANLVTNLAYVLASLPKSDGGG